MFQNLLRRLHKLHETSRHVVRSGETIVHLAVLAKAQENRVDRHLVHREETLTDEQRYDCAEHDGEKCVMQSRFSLKMWKIKKVSIGSKTMI